MICIAYSVTVRINNNLYQFVHLYKIQILIKSYCSNFRYILQHQRTWQKLMQQMSGSAKDLGKSMHGTGSASVGRFKIWSGCLILFWQMIIVNMCILHYTENDLGFGCEKMITWSADIVYLNIQVNANTSSKFN